ncbi:TolB family protein [Streptosporangium sp. NPDC004631]
MKHWAMAVGTAVAVSAVASPATASSRPAPVTGAVYSGYQGGGVEVLTHRGGWSRRSVGGGGFVGQFSAAPGGGKVAWIDSGNRLHVKTANADRVIAKDAAYGGPCSTPAWTADGRRIAYPVKGTAETTAVTVIGADGRNPVKAGRTMGVCHLTWSADGRTLAGYAGDTDGVHLLDTGSLVSRRAPGIKLANHVQSLSPDAGRVVVHTIGANAPGGDGSWPQSFTPSIYDTKTGRRLPIPVGGRLLGALYLRDGRLAVRVQGRPANTLVILDASGKEIQRVPEPAKARNLALLHVLG